MVLGVSQSRLSTLLSKPQPWHLLTKRVQALYQRMQLWMETRATYGNNPFHWEKNIAKFNIKKSMSCGYKKKPRSLIKVEENVNVLEVENVREGLMLN